MIWENMGTNPIIRVDTKYHRPLIELLSYSYICWDILQFKIWQFQSKLCTYSEKNRTFQLYIYTKFYRIFGWNDVELSAEMTAFLIFS